MAVLFINSRDLIALVLVAFLVIAWPAPALPAPDASVMSKGLNFPATPT